MLSICIKAKARTWVEIYTGQEWEEFSTKLTENLDPGSTRMSCGQTIYSPSLKGLNRELKDKNTISTTGQFP